MVIPEVVLGPLLPVAKVLQKLGACFGVAAAALFYSNSYRGLHNDLEYMMSISIYN